MEMPNPRNLSEVWASLVNRFAENTAGALFFQTSIHGGLDATTRDQGRQAQRDYERDTAGRDAERSLRGDPPCAGSRDLTQTGGTHGGLPPGTGGRQGQIPI